MRTRRIFLSHSSDEAAVDGPGRLEREAREALAAALVAAGYEVLLDKHGLRAGDRWREVVNGWIGHCDGAVALVSEKAIASDWFAYEVSVVGFFAARPGTTFRLVPLRLVPGKRIREWNLNRPAQLLESQGTDLLFDAALDADAAARKAAVDAAVQKIVTDLGSLLPAASTPLERAAYRLHETIAGIQNPVLLQNLAERLAPLTDGWTLGPDPARRLALRMMTAGLDGCGDVLNDLQGILGDAAFKDLVDVLGSSWVDEPAVEALSSVFAEAAGSRAVAARARDPLSARFYVWARREEQPSRGWRLEAVEWDSGAPDPEGQARDLEARVAEKLMEVTARPSLEAARTTLGNWAKKLRKRVFVALPRAGLNAPLVDRLRGAFPELGLFLLDCASGPADPMLAPGRVVYLEPDLSAKHETTYLDSYRGMADALDLPVQPPWRSP